MSHDSTPEAIALEEAKPKMGDLNDGVKIIRANTYRFEQPDDESLPFKLEMDLQPPEFMFFAFIGLIGNSEEIVARAESLEALKKFVEGSHLRSNPRTRRATITGPDGIIEEWGFLVRGDVDG